MPAGLINLRETRLHKHLATFALRQAIDFLSPAITNTHDVFLFQIQRVINKRLWDKYVYRRREVRAF